MKQVLFRISPKILALLFGLFLSMSTYAQVTVKGLVKDATGEAVIGANVIEKGTTNGTITDFDGNFQLQVKKGSTLVVSFVGYVTQEVAAQPNLIVTLKDDSEMLQDVVVIGYGVAKKNDLTGSVTAIKPDKMNRGLTTNAQDMITGKIAGVNVTSAGGTPGAGATIRIRGGASLTASNDPLIVIDGLAMDNNGVQGLSNPLSMVNPNDIESFTVLKDASATAIYGSRASNGVIIITTKKGSKSGRPTVTYDGNVSVSSVKKTVDVLSGDEFREYVTNMYGEGSDAVKHLGTANTDWQDLIYRTAVSTDHNLSIAGAVKDIPYRLSIGYTNQEGIVKTSKFERYTAALALTPSFFEDHLKVNANLKGMIAKNHYNDGGVIGAAVTMDPTQSVYSDDPNYVKAFGGYFQWTTTNPFAGKDTAWPLYPNSLANMNPVAALNQKNDRATSKTLIGNLEVDYKFHFLPDLHFHMNGGMDLSTGKQTTDIDPESYSNNYYGSYYNTNVDKYNLSFNSYLQYLKDFSKQHFDAMAGYEWQHFHREGNSIGSGFYQSTYNDAGDTSLAGKPYNATTNPWAVESYLVSFFGRANYSLLDRYMLTATIRFDGSSKFNKDNRWGTFPSVAFAWKINEEGFLKDNETISDLKLRLGWGMTGQQEGIGEYSYYASYVNNKEHAYYPIGLGNGETNRPNAYNNELTWEKTTTYNAGLDLGLLNNRFTASVDGYYRKTTDLLQSVAVASGSNFKNYVTSNVGSLENYGVEFSMNGKVIQQQGLTWDLGYNITWNKNKITELTSGSGDNYKIETGGIAAGTGNNCQAHSVGHAANSFYVYQQVYDKDGMPIENVYVDRNGDGIVNPDDRYYYKKPTPDVTMGLTSKLIYKNWDFNFSLRASLGNYVFNDVQSNNCNQGEAAVYAQSGFLTNFTKIGMEPKFTGQGNYYLSDYFVQNASFLKCDNITLGYSFMNFLNAGLNGRVYATVQNVFTITDYKGLDPEVSGGIDNNIYPRPFVALLGLSLNF